MTNSDEQRRQAAAEYRTDPIAVNRQVVEDYRAAGGKVERLGGTARMLLLTTTGARSGDRHTAPMMFARDGDRLVVFASNMGARHHPGWYHNLLAHPEVTVELGTETFEALALVTTGAERDRLWALFPFPQHQETARRQIPVVALETRRG